MFEKRAKLGFHDLPREWVVHLFGGLQVEDGAVPLFRFQGYSDILKVKPVQRSLSNDIASGMLLSPDVVFTAIARPELQVPDTHPWAVLTRGPFHSMPCSVHGGMPRKQRPLPKIKQDTRGTPHPPRFSSHKPVHREPGWWSPSTRPHQPRGHFFDIFDDIVFIIHLYPSQ
jgi:hypothetical protein